MLPQTPSAPVPLSALLHASQSPAHAVSQQTPLTQETLVHWLEAVQATPCAFWGVQEPPSRVGSQKAPAAQSVSTEQGMQTGVLQSPLWQSPAILQSFELAHGGQEPPQSTSVSLPFLIPSLQLGATAASVPTSATVPSSVSVSPSATVSSSASAPPWASRVRVARARDRVFDDHELAFTSSRARCVPTCALRRRRRSAAWVARTHLAL